MISFTLFKNQYDNKTHRQMSFESFDKFEELLYALSKRPIASKKDAELISPAVYRSDTTRANRNVVEWGGWAAVDVDDHKFEGDLENELAELYGDWYYVCYSTASSSDDHPKFRLVFPLKTAVRTEDIKPFWFALQSALGDIGDKQTKDLSRMYYTPATYSGANNFIFTNHGSYIDPDALMSKYPYAGIEKAKSFFDRLPEEMQKSILEHRKAKSTNTDFHWTSYKDCPFISRRQIAEYKSIGETGWYAKMYQIMCATALRAVEKKYPITASELETLMRELDVETGNWYQNRPLNVEAENAIEYAYRHAG